MIAVEHLVRRFGTVVALDDVSFPAADGAITGILGPNGAGKTTLMRILATLILPDSGIARVDDHDCVADPMAVRQRFGILSDAKGLYPRLTARENVAYLGRLHGLRSALIRERSDSLFARLDMQALADRRTDGFSQGEKMKTAIARALIHDPQNVLLDEPTNGLDVIATRAMRELILALKGAGKCVLFSSHIMQEVSAVCDRIIVLSRGKVVASGTPIQLVKMSGRETLEDAFVTLLGSAEGLEP
ncbi:MAG: ATP-binding cassette domain-containing protein [Betaproteobacteria bacterium]